MFFAVVFSNPEDFCWQAETTGATTGQKQQNPEYFGQILCLGKIKTEDGGEIVPIERPGRAVESCHNFSGSFASQGTSWQFWSLLRTKILLVFLERF